MSIFRTSDPTAWDDVDGIIVNESAPAPNVQGVAANVAILVGQTQRGLGNLTEVGSIGEFLEKYGKDNTKGVNKALKNKKFGRLKIVRVTAAAAVTASLTLDDGGDPDDILEIEAKQGPGAYGNLIKVTVEAGSTAGKKYTIQDTNPGSVLPVEVYDNVQVASLASNNVFSSSKLVNVTVLATTAEPENMVATSLASGADGAVADSDYEDAIAKCEVEGAGNVLFLDAYNSARNEYLQAHVAAAPDKMVICCGDEDDDVAAAKTDAATLRDTEGRIIYAYPWVETLIDGVLTFVPPASFVASIISQTSPHVDPAASENMLFTQGISSLKLSMTRNDYIQCKEHGICAFEHDSDQGGFKLKSGIVTQIANSSKVMIMRRRMADFLTASAARFLKNYQNAPNTKRNRTLIKAAILGFVKSLQNVGILPTDADITEGSVTLVDTESQNTAETLAAGFLYINWKQRIHSSMRFIVLNAEIGESVVVQEGEG